MAPSTGISRLRADSGSSCDFRTTRKQQTSRKIQAPPVSAPADFRQTKKRIQKYPLQSVVINVIDLYDCAPSGEKRMTSSSCGKYSITRPLSCQRKNSAVSQDILPLYDSRHSQWIHCIMSYCFTTDSISSSKFDTLFLPEWNNGTGIPEKDLHARRVTC